MTPHAIVFTARQVNGNHIPDVPNDVTPTITATANDVRVYSRPAAKRDDVTSKRKDNDLTDSDSDAEEFCDTSDVADVAFDQQVRFAFDVSCVAGK